jgi:integrase
MPDRAMEERSRWAKRSAAAGVKSLTCVKEGFHSWEVEEVRQFEKRHPVGSTARLAMALMLYTGMRRSDAVLLGPDHVKNGWIKFTPKKASGTTGKTLELPLLKVLDDVINASATGAETFLVTSQGTKFSTDCGCREPRAAYDDFPVEQRGFEPPTSDLRRCGHARD